MFIRRLCRTAHRRTVRENYKRPFIDLHDVISICVRLLRSMTMGNYHDCQLFWDCYSLLHSFIDTSHVGRCIWKNKEGLYALISAQCFADATVQLHDVDAHSSTIPLSVSTARREHICSKLKKICPGATSHWLLFRAPLVNSTLLTNKLRMSSIVIGQHLSGKTCGSYTFGFLGPPTHPSHLPAHQHHSQHHDHCHQAPQGLLPRSGWHPLQCFQG